MVTPYTARDPPKTEIHIAIDRAPRVRSSGTFVHGVIAELVASSACVNSGRQVVAPRYD